MDQFNVGRLMEFPVETLTQEMILKFKPLNLDVLPLLYSSNGDVSASALADASAQKLGYAWVGTALFVPREIFIGICRPIPRASGTLIRSHGSCCTCWADGSQ